MKTTKNRGGSRSNLNPRHKNEAKNLNHLNYHNQAARKHKRRLANTKVKMQVMKKNKTKEKKISFYLKLGKYKKFKFMWFCILETIKMNDVNRNRINNYLYRYSIKNNTANFNKIAEVITKREYFVYRKILYIINNCRVVEEDSDSITVEIDLVEHNHLLEDITKKFFTKELSTRKVEKKVEHTYIIGNPFLTTKIYNGFWKIYYM